MFPFQVSDFLRSRGVAEGVIKEFEKQKIDGVALAKMNETHFESLGLSAMGDRLALIAFCAPKEESLDEKVERLKEALNGKGKRSRESATVDGKIKKASKPTLKIEFGWKHYHGGKFVQVKKGKGGGNRSVDMKRIAEYEECLLKAQELFFPKLSSQYGKFTAMDAHLGNYNAEKIEEQEFTVENYKTMTGMSLPRLYLVTKAKAKSRILQQKTPTATHTGSDSLSSNEVQRSLQNDMLIPVTQELPVNFMQADEYDGHEMSDLVPTDESQLIQSRVAWCCKESSKTTISRTFKPTAVVKDLYTWVGCLPSVPSHFSVVLDSGPILKDLSQQLCHIGRHIIVEVLQILPDVITGTDLLSSELRCLCAICKEGLILPNDMVARPNNCLHIFHLTCIDEWLKVDNEGMSCPICETLFTCTIMCSAPKEPSEAKRCSGVLSQESQDPIANNISVEAQPLVFEEYMDNGQEAVKLYDARTKSGKG
ncbi:hypothetical protein OS493_010841 [Desmophyllum pertusum]|uniref:RING-type domain-containing protein n=1 Tax=Desmophyllum pertusum TaxID=174260 RepID=A0A9X0CYE3_9CNID|nr:hypothetical protein OS493_010841 [Desmophyllum pertusum]